MTLGGNRESSITCAFCDTLAVTDDDHIPPKGLFPDEPQWRVNLITVPACKYCNKGHELDDQYLQILLGSLESVSRHPAAKSFVDRARRARERASPALRSRLESELREVELRTPAGLYVGRGIVFVPDLPRLMRFARMIVTGLYFHHQRKRLPTTHIVAGTVFPDPMTRTEDDERRVAAVVAQFASDELRQTGAGVFEYRYHVHPNDPDGMEWLMSLYGSFVFGGSIVRRSSELGRIAEQEEQRASVRQFRRSKKQLERVMNETTASGPLPSLESLERIEDQVLSDTSVTLDGKHFIHCKFLRCKILYSGGVVPLLSGATFDSCVWEFTEAAERTMHFLGRLYQVGAAGMVEGVFDSVRKGRRGT